jgi:hypothetical protein
MHKLHRAPFRCRGCQNRFFVYIPGEDKAEETSVDTTGPVEPKAGAKPAEH